MDKRINTIITNLLAMEYNVGIIILTTLLWVLCCYFGYSSNNNFDMLSTVESCIIGLSLVSILIGTLGQDRWRKLIKLGIITKIAAIFALVTSKSLIASSIGLLILFPVSIFCFFMLLKHIWLDSSKNSKK